MSDEKDTSKRIETWIDPATEARIVALVLGEASDFERDDLENLMRERPELRAFYRRMTATHDLLSESEKPAAAAAEPWRMSDERRKAVLEKLRSKADVESGKALPAVTVPKTGRRKSRPMVRVLVPFGIAAAVAAMMMPVTLSKKWSAAEMKTQGMERPDHAVTPGEEFRWKESPPSDHFIAPQTGPVSGSSAVSDSRDFGLSASDRDADRSSMVWNYRSVENGDANGNQSRAWGVRRFEGEPEAEGKKQEEKPLSQLSSPLVDNKTAKFSITNGAEDSEALQFETTRLNRLAESDFGDDSAEIQLDDKQLNRMDSEELQRSSRNKGSTTLSADFVTPPTAEPQSQSGQQGQDWGGIAGGGGIVTTEKAPETNSPAEGESAGRETVTRFAREKRESIESGEVAEKQAAAAERTAGTAASARETVNGPMMMGRGGLDTELPRRQAALLESQEDLSMAKRKLAEKDYEGAIEKLKSASERLVPAPVTEATRNEALALLSETAAELAQEKAMEGQFDTAQQLLGEALEANPDHKRAKKIKDRLDDPEWYNRAITPDHVANVKEVESKLNRADDFFQIGDLDGAQMEFEKTLRIDKYNSAARKGLEEIEQARIKYHESTRDHTRAQMLRKVDGAWETPIPVAGTEKGNTAVASALRSGGNAIMSQPVLEDELALEESEVEEDSKKAITGENLKTLTFAVPSDFLSSNGVVDTDAVDDPFASTASVGGGLKRKSTARDVLESKGVEFPEGASAVYSPSAGKLIVRGTEAELAKVAEITNAEVEEIDEMITDSRRSGDMNGRRPELTLSTGGLAQDQPVPARGFVNGGMLFDVEDEGRGIEERFRGEVEEAERLRGRSLGIVPGQTVITGVADLDGRKSRLGRVENPADETDKDGDGLQPDNQLAYFGDVAENSVRYGYAGMKKPADGFFDDNAMDLSGPEVVEIEGFIPYSATEEGAAPVQVAETEGLDVAQKVVPDAPVAILVPGRDGQVFSPFAPGKPVDVSGYPAGTRMRCPYTGKEFKVPEFETKTEALKETDRTTAAPETETADEPFSTFSLHVSDVSFKLAQAALLEKGEWPEAEKIRVEEFVNAFDYGDPPAEMSERVACRMEQSAHPFLAERNLLRVSMRTAAMGRDQSQPLRLTVLLDLSGSMERSDREASVVKAMEALAGHLSKEDTVTLIGFAREPRLLADRYTGDRAAELVKLVAAAPSEGGTNLEEALKLAGEVAGRQFDESGQNRIVLLTDGAANLGNAEPESLSERIVALRQAGIAFDACGVGADGLNDAVLEALTRDGDGRYYFLNRPEDADESFVKQLAGALRPAAKNVKVQVKFNPDRVPRYRLLGFEKHILKKEDFRNDSVDAAEMASAEAGVAVYQYQVDPAGEGDIGEVFVRFQDMATGEMVERSWPVPFEKRAPSFDEAAPALQLAGCAAFLGEKLRGGPEAGNIELGELMPVARAVRTHCRNSPRVNQLIEMMEKARSLKPANE